MFSWLAKRILDHGYRRLNAGDPSFILRLDAEDVRFRFPGESSWSADIHGKEELARWLDRMIATGLQHRPEQVIAQGPPWNMTICLRGTDHLRSPEGETVYANRYVIWGRMAWGRLREYEVYEDTQKSAALDEYLGARESAASRETAAASRETAAASRETAAASRETAAASRETAAASRESTAA
jgi:ketosteroid isomerase-like protein